jgi:hypothetical protein
MNKENLAPIALFVYNRLNHTQRTIEALQKNTLASGSDLIIFSDGPKESLESQEKVSELRKYLKTVKGFKNVEIVESEKNRGLAKSIISGVTDILNKHKKIIVLEDDLVTSRYFLEYLNNGLNLYEDENDVISIHAYTYPIKSPLPETYFIKGADCWGWATWKRGWDLFEANGQKLLKELMAKKLTKEFDFDDSSPYTKMLKTQIAGKNDSWAIRWYASAFLNNKLTLYPRESLVYNTGFDGSGTHHVSEDSFNKTDQIENIKVEVRRIKIKESLDARPAFISYFKSQNNLWAKGKKLFKKLLKYEPRN